MSKKLAMNDILRNYSSIWCNFEKWRIHWWQTFCSNSKPIYIEAQNHFCTPLTYTTQQNLSITILPYQQILPKFFEPPVRWELTSLVVPYYLLSKPHSCYFNVTSQAANFQIVTTCVMMVQARNGTMAKIEIWDTKITST